MSKNTRSNRNRAVRFSESLMLAAMLYSAPSNSTDVDAGFSVGVGYTDNINRVATDPLEETIAQTGIALSVFEASRRIDADIRGSLNYYDYLDDTYDSDLVGALDALVDINVVEGRVTWLIQENYGRALFDPFQPARPENWENVNFLTTGPTIVLFQTGRNDAGIDLRYSTMNYETRPFDNDRRGARFWIGREVQRDRTLSINLDVEKVEFDNADVTPEYERRSAYLSYAGDEGRNLFGIDVGFTEQEILSETNDGVTFNVNWTHQISTRSQFSLNAGRQFADQGNVFRYQQSITRDIDSIGDLTENGSPFVMNIFDVGYSLTGERTTLAISAGVSEQEYETQGQLDRKDAQLSLFAQRDVLRSLFVGIELQFNRREFTNIAREDDTNAASLTLGYRLNDALDLSLRYAYVKRDSSTITNEFEENRGDLTLTYTPTWGR